MTHGSLFSGIGGFDLAAREAGLTNIFQVEIDDSCRKILTKNFPNVKRYKDIREFNASEYRNRIDVVSGGFPCQPFSQAGKRKGKEDDRYLWAEMLRVISEIKPRWVIAENVYGLLTIDDGMVFKQLLADLENIGYETQPFIIPALAVGLPHRRNRVWIIANSNSERQLQSERIEQSERQWISNGNTDIANALRSEQKCSRNTRTGRSEFTNNTFNRNWLEVATSLCRVDDGIPRQLDRAKRIRALGNAIVPQIAYQIFKAILETEKQLLRQNNV